jgi:hypothetical protein
LVDQGKKDQDKTNYVEKSDACSNRKSTVSNELCSIPVHLERRSRRWQHFAIGSSCYSSKNAVARGEALHKAELSDGLVIVFKILAELSGGDPDPLYISIFKIADGKTNKNSDAIYGRAMRLTIRNGSARGNGVLPNLAIPLYG